MNQRVTNNASVRRNDNQNRDANVQANQQVNNNASVLENSQSNAVSNNLRMRVMENENVERLRPQIQQDNV